MDWMSAEEGRSMVERLAAGLRPGCLVLWRQLNNRTDRRPWFGTGFDFGDIPADEDRSLFFAEGLANGLLEFVTGVHVHAVAAFELVGGPVIAGFVMAMIWGVLIGTYSSVFVAAPILLYLGVRREAFDKESTEGDGKESPA